MCHEVMFAELVRLQRATGAGLEELQRITGCGTGCGMCVPYIKVALKTGRVRLPIMTDDELKRLAE